MKSKLERHRHDHARGVVVYRDDLEAMLSRMTESGFQVTISDGEHEYANLGEVLAQRGKRPRSLTLEGVIHEPHYTSVTVDCSGSAAIHSFGSDVAMNTGRALFEMAARRRDFVYRIATHWITFPACMLVGLSAMFAVHSLPLWATLTLSCAPFVAVAGMFYERRHTCVRLTASHEDGFIFRQRDNLILLVVGAILGAIFTELVHHIAGRGAGQP